MKKTVLATAIALASSMASAHEIYNSDDLSLDIGGNIQLMAFNGENANDATIADNGSRLHVSFSTSIADGWTGKGYFESYVNTVAAQDVTSYDVNSQRISFTDDRSDLFTNRESYFSAINDNYGEISIGKKQSVFTDVTMVTDIFNVYSQMAAGTYSYGDGGIVGTGRADQVIQYKNAFKIGGNELSFGVQNSFADDNINITQCGQDCPTDPMPTTSNTINRSGGYAYKLAYNVDDGLFTVGASQVKSSISGSYLDLDGKSQTVEDPEAWTASMSSTLGNLYMAAVYTNGKEIHQTDEGTPFNGIGKEIAVSYKMGRFTPQIGWNHVDSNDDAKAGQYEMDYTILTLNYQLNHNMFAFIEGNLDNGTNQDGSDSQNGYVSVGMYLPF